MKSKTIGGFCKGDAYGHVSHKMRNVTKPMSIPLKKSPHVVPDELTRL